MRWSTGKSKTPKRWEWHPFFVLLPLRVGDTWVWLETIGRLGTYVPQETGYDCFEPAHYTYEFRLPIRPRGLW